MWIAGQHIRSVECIWGNLTNVGVSSVRLYIFWDFVKAAISSKAQYLLTRLVSHITGTKYS